MKKTLIAALALVAMVGCNKTLIESPIAESEYGYLTLGITSNPDMIITKGTEDTSDYLITLLHASEQNGTYSPVAEYENVKLSTIDDVDNSVNGRQIKLSQGYYKLKAQSAVEAYTDDDKGVKYFYGESTTPVSLAAGGNASLSASCSVYNTAVSVKATPEFSTTFLNEVVTVSTTYGTDNSTRSYKFIDEDNQITATGEFDSNDMVYFPATSTCTDNSSEYCAKLNINIKANTTASQNTLFEYNISKESKRAKWTQITLNAGQNGTITLTISSTDDLDTQNPVTEIVVLDPTSSGVVIPNN